MVYPTYDPNGSRSLANSKKRYGHNLNRNLHAADVARLCRHHYLNKTPLKHVYDKVYSDFMEMHPEIYCKDIETFKRWAKNVVPSFVKIETTPEVIDQTIDLLAKYIRERKLKKATIARRVYEEINHSQRLITEKHVKSLWDKAVERSNPRTPTDQWKDEYMPILMHCFYRYTTPADSFIKFFGRRTKTNFSAAFLRDKVIEGLEPLPPKQFFVENLNNYYKRKVKVLVLDHRHYGLTEPEIWDKLIAFFKAEGYIINPYRAKRIIKESMSVELHPMDYSLSLHRKLA